MKVRLVMAAIAAIPSVTCFGGLFDNALKAVSDTAKAVTASPAETREEAERDRQKALLEESERIKAEDRKKIEAEEEARRQQREKEYAERKAKNDAEEAARKARREQEEKDRLAKEQQNCQSRVVRACVVAERGNKDNVYVDAGLRNSFKGSVQYEPNSLIRTHVPLYKEICSGSSIGWVIDNGYLSEKLGRINVHPFAIPEVNYRGCLFEIDEGVGLCCAASRIAAKPIVEVWGMRKECPKTFSASFFFCASALRVSSFFFSASTSANTAFLSYTIRTGPLASVPALAACPSCASICALAAISSFLTRSMSFLFQNARSFNVRLAVSSMMYANSPSYSAPPFPLPNFTLKDAISF